MLSECLTTNCLVSCSTASSLWDSVQLVAQRSAKRFIDHVNANLLKCNIKPSDLEALASDRDIWRTVCDTGLRSFLNGSITTSEERCAARHTASTKLKTGPRCPQCSRVCASDFGLTCGPMTRPATLSSSATSSSNSTDLQQQHIQNKLAPVSGSWCMFCIGVTAF